MERKITIDPITRLEGHGKIEILLNDQGDVDRARLEVVGRGDAEPVNRENVAAPENRRVRFVRLQSNR